MHATRTLGHIFWRAGILTIDEKSTPPAAETPNTGQKKLSPGLQNAHNKSESGVLKFVCSCECA